MRIMRRAEYRRMPWKNGQGVTEEVATFPAESGIDDFGWRLSIAHVGADGPFSVFAGIDRSIALLDGRGLTLDLPQERTVKLMRDGPPFAFSGDWKVSSRNLDGPTIDFNMMTRRGRFTHETLRLTLGFNETLTAPAFGWAVFNTQSKIEVAGQELAIERFDAISLDAGDSFTSSLNHPSEVVFTRIDLAE